MIADPIKFIRVADQPFNMVAIIIRGGKIVSVGHNNYKRRSYKFKRQNKYADQQGIHAEMDAIRKWKNKKSGATMVIVGLSKAGNIIENSMPCFRCINAIIGVNKISTIRYVEDGIWKIRKIRNNAKV